MQQQQNVNDVFHFESKTCYAVFEKHILEEIMYRIV